MSLADNSDDSPYATAQRPSSTGLEEGTDPVRRYSIEFLLSFKDLPHLRERPECLSLETLLKLRSAPSSTRKEKKPRRTSTSAAKALPGSEQQPNAPTVRGGRSRQVQFTEEGDDDDDEELLFAPPPGLNIHKQATNAPSARGREKKERTSTPASGRSGKGSNGMPSGLTDAQMFELERLKARAKYQKTSEGATSNQTLQIPEESSFFSSTPDPSLLRPLESTSSYNSDSSSFRRGPAPSRSFLDETKTVCILVNSLEPLN